MNNKQYMANCSFKIRLRTISYIVFLCININVYGHNISGLIINSNNSEPIEGASINIFTTDSIKIGSTYTRKDGTFLIKKVPSGNYFLTASFLNCETHIIQISNLAKDIHLGTIEMSRKAIALSEISVIENRNLNRVDRQIIFPRASQIATSSSAVDVLSKLMLPGLMINTVTNTISTQSPKGVQIRINDVKSTTEDLLSIPPQSIARIEYIDMPGVRYGDVSEVINIVTRQNQGGGVVGTSLRQALTTVYGNDNAYAKINHKESEFGIAYNLIYGKLSDSYSNNDLIFLLSDGTEYNIHKQGVKSPYRNTQHHLSLSYNWVKDRNTVLNILFRNKLANPRKTTVQHVFEGNAKHSFSNLKTGNKSCTPSIDLYFSKKINDKHSIVINGVGTLIDTDYSRDYKEYILPDESLDAYYEYTTDGKKYSLIGEAIYEYVIKSGLIFSSGLQYSQAYVKNLYDNVNSDNVENIMHNSEGYLYAQMQGKISKLAYQIGFGLSRQYFNENTGKYTYYTFRPQVSLSYPLSSKIFLRYMFNITPLLPSLSNLSDIKQQLNKYEVIEGNPHLKPYRAYVNNLIYRIGYQRINIQLSCYYQYNKNPIMSTAVKRVEDNNSFQFIYGNDNQKSFHHLQARLHTRIEMIKDWLSLSLSGGLNRYINNGNEYTHTYTGCFGGVQLEGNYKNWMLSANFNTDLNYLFAEMLNYSSKSTGISVKYKYKDCQIGGGVMNPFLANGTPSGSKILSSVVKKESWNYTRDYGNMVYITLSWNFSFGRKYNSSQKKLNNSDNDSGIVK